jgi:hypothetical protein
MKTFAAYMLGCLSFRELVVGLTWPNIDTALRAFCDVRPYGQLDDLDFPRVAFSSIRDVFAVSTIEYAFLSAIDMSVIDLILCYTARSYRVSCSTAQVFS